MQDLEKRTLSNGIDVYFYVDKNCKKVFASYNVNFGSCGKYNDFYYDGKKYHIMQGTAHFIEHTLIEKSKYGNMIFYYKDKDYYTNGSTAYDFTSYYFCGVKDTKKSLEMLINLVDDPVFTKEDIEDVKPAVIEELKSIFNNRYRIAYNSAMRNSIVSYEMCEENCNPIGNIKDTENLTYEAVKLAYDAYYHDQNKYLVIGGNIDVDKMTKYLEEIYAKLPKHPNKLTPIKNTETLDVRKEKEILEYDVESNALYVAYKYHKKLNISDLEYKFYWSMFNVMKFSTAKEQMKALQKDGTIIYGLDLMCENVDDINIIRLYANTHDENKLLKEIEGLLNTSNLTLKEFELLKKNRIADSIRIKDYVYDALEEMPYMKHLTEKIYQIDTYKNLNYETFLKVIEEFDSSHKTVTVIKNKKN